MADEKVVSPHNPGEVFQVEQPNKSGGTHFTTVNPSEKWRHSHDTDKDGNLIPDSDHKKKQ